MCIYIYIERERERQPLVRAPLDAVEVPSQLRDVLANRERLLKMTTNKTKDTTANTKNPTSNNNNNNNTSQLRDVLGCYYVWKSELGELVESDSVS